MKKNILIIGNLGYVGPVVVNHLFASNNYNLIGLDNAYFYNCITTKIRYPEFGLSHQYFLDVRNLASEHFKNIDSVVYLAAISNDPMGVEYENPTYEINQNCAVKAAEYAKKNKVKNFIFASSCSVYGTASEGKKTEVSELNPLTAYAKSKIGAELKLKELVNEDFHVTCLRFATACGYSPRLRLDLVLNDFVASAILNKEINILSDGKPWRPLIHVRDMARAIQWAIERNDQNIFLSINTGSNDWNYQVMDLATAVSNQIKGTKVVINQNAQPDKRSYQVDFSLFKKLASEYQPVISLADAVEDLIVGMQNNGISDFNFRESNTYIRLKTLNFHRKNNLLNSELYWLK